MMTVILACAPCMAQTGDATLLREAAFRSEAPAGRDSTGILNFFRNSVKKGGAIPAVFITADHITRSGRLGSFQRAQRSGTLPDVAEGRVPKPLYPGKAGLHASGDMDFIAYLIGNNMERDAALLLNSGRYCASDTLSYLKGWADYSAKYLEDACESFDQVPKDSPFYDKSLFFNVISNAHLGRYGRSAELLRGYGGPYAELRSLEEAGIALLEDRAADYLTAAEGFTFSQYALADSERQLQGIYNERYSGREKSPVLAAAASALVPGLGKVYAGEAAEGAASFLAVGSLAAITAENWVKHGLKDWKTILFGTVGAIFYIGNIYGSYVSVSIHNNGLRDAQDTAILYHIHIPLRSVFQ